MEKRIQKAIILTCLMLMLTGGIAWKSMQFTAFRRETFSVSTPGHDNIECVLYTPIERPPPYPLVITLHSIFQCEGLVRPLIDELTRRGSAVVYIHFKGYDHTQKSYKSFSVYCKEIQSVLSHVTRRNDIDREQVALVGHSIGANLATEVARMDPGVSTTVALGFPAVVDRNMPVNSLFITGLLDQLHPVQEMLEELRSSTGNREAVAGVTYGDFTARTARKLIVAPLCDHHLEIFDPFFLSETAAWLDRSAGKKTEKGTVKEPIPTIGHSFFLLGMGLLAFQSFLFLAKGARIVMPRWLQRKILTLASLPIFLILSSGAFTGKCDVPRESALTVLIALMGVHYFGSRDEKDIWRDMKRGLLHGAVIWLAFWCGIIVNRGDALLHYPSCIAFLPPLLLMSIPLDFFIFITRTASALFSCDGALPPFYILLLVELFFPGFPARLAAGFFARFIDFLKHIRLSFTMKSSPASLALLAATIAAAVIAWRQILHEGYDFGGSAFAGFLLLFFNLIIVPLTLSFIAFRSTWFKKLEEEART